MQRATCTLGFIPFVAPSLDTPQCLYSMLHIVLVHVYSGTLTVVGDSAYLRLTGELKIHVV